jgi:serine protease Do/serine protease DegQ
MARSVMGQLAKTGEVRRGRIGLTTQDLTAELAKSLAAGVSNGAVVVEVVKGSPAEKAGLRVGDVITAVNGRAIRGSSDLRNQIGLVAIGTEVEFKVLREGREQLFRTRVEALRAPQAGEVESMVPELTGLSVANAERNGRAEAVGVVAVESGSQAWSHGLRPGDVIVAVNRRKVRSTRELMAALRTPGSLVLTVVRGEAVFGITLRQ